MRKIWFVLAGIVFVAAIIFLRVVDRLPPKLFKIAGIFILALAMVGFLIYIYSRGNQTGVWNK